VMAVDMNVQLLVIRQTSHFKLHCCSQMVVAEIFCHTKPTELRQIWLSTVQIDVLIVRETSW